MGTSFSNLISR